MSKHTYVLVASEIDEAARLSREGSTYAEIATAMGVNRDEARAYVLTDMVREREAGVDVVDVYRRIRESRYSQTTVFAGIRAAVEDKDNGSSATMSSLLARYGV